ncbi:MAG: putative DNA binding domain-containing protein [Succinivibrio sp.]|nr:putative DNA binding domain-containing protein [Succinivibrio sp.]
MKIEDIIRGESKTVEFKEMPPQSSEKYTKTVIAFANTQGGMLVFGVADGSREIVGVDETTLFQTMDSITNAIIDSCEPQIVPEVEPCTLGGKTIIVVTVAPGALRPYHQKFKGKEAGTYIRVGATTRLASADKIKDLEMEGAKISWDELTCVGYAVTENAIEKLCNDLNARRRAMREHRHLAENLPMVTSTNLENWKVLKKTHDGYLASNAFVLLTSAYFPFSKTQCAVFKNNDRSVFLEKREYSGPLYEQIEDAVNFVLRNIRLGAKIEGVIRTEAYELPVEAIREMIVNAHCHRNLTDQSCVQVAIYDDRLEVTSPGGLYNGLTLEEALQGHSRLRNRAIANVFSQIGLIEAWGTGLQRIQNAAKENGLPEPEFIDMPESFRVILYRRPLHPPGISQPSLESLQRIGNGSVESQQRIGNRSVESRPIGDFELTDTQHKIAVMLSEEPKMTGALLAARLGIAPRNIEINIKKLKDRGVLLHHGPSKGGYWEVVK